jgi:hypothetical protein
LLESVLADSRHASQERRIGEQRFPLADLIQRLLALGRTDALGELRVPGNGEGRRDRVLHVVRIGDGGPSLHPGMLWIAHLSEDLVYLGDHLAVHEKEVLTGSVVKLDLAVRRQGRTWWFPAPFPERILRGVGERTV